MPAVSTGGLGDIVVQAGKILASALEGDATKMVTLTVTGISGLDDDDASAEKDPSADLFQSLGVVGRPLPPDASGYPAGYAEHESIRRGGNLRPIAYRDIRLAASVPNLKSGAIGLAGYAGGFILFDPSGVESGGRKVDTLTIYMPYEFANGVATKAHVISCGLDGNGVPIVELASGEGPSVTLLDKELTLANAAGDCWVRIDDSSTTIVGPLKAHGGADLGGTASVPLAKSLELTVWAALVNGALNTLGVPIAPLSPSVATVLTKGA